MAIFHVSTSTPTKAELIERWLPDQPWGPARGVELEQLGSFRFDDPEGQVGLETHLVGVDGTIYHVPLTYRDAPLEEGRPTLVGTLEHSALGTRWVYDGLSDPRFVMMLAGVALTGQGEALGLAQHEGRWYIAPSEVSLAGGGWSTRPAAVDGFVEAETVEGRTILRNHRFELTVFRRPERGAQPAIGLTATWAGQPDPVVLAEIRRR